MRWPMVVACAAFAFAPVRALGHGGGLDANGCHTDSKTGSYHCHRGAPSSGGGDGGSGSRGYLYIAPASTPGASQPKPKAAAAAVAGPATLVSVGDGDTIRVTTPDGQKVTIRMACIDAPETAQGESGAMATRTLKQLLSAGQLEIRPQTVDRYGRTVAEVYAGGRNVNLEMVRVGAAYVYRQYLRGCHESAYLEAEAQAERFRQGVWRWGNELKPWDFRKQRRG